MAKSTFEGLCVLALESRRAREMAKLIANFDGVPMVAPSVREIPLESNQEALEFARKLAAGQFDMVIFTTGAGVRALTAAVQNEFSASELSRYLNLVAVVARGPKPVAVLRELGVRVSLSVPEPNTWRDLLTLLDERRGAFPLAGCRIAVQEYGVTNPELFAGLEKRGAMVTPVNVYQWALPEDLTPLQKAVESVINGDVHVLLVASSVQIRHLFTVAERMAKVQALHESLARVVIASIGPMTSEELRRRSLKVDIECTHPKIGILVQEAAEQAPRLLNRKRSLHPAATENCL
ncbi:MAG TPA: uroporphyrinogen-III synthase [Terriglobales bacterium]|nr:uroporphyrinogen-III synthase [Terriglobales bacterium]